MPTIFSGVENRISEARERHQELHRTTRQDVTDWRTQAARLTSTVNALNEANEALDTKANANNGVLKQKAANPGFPS